MLELVDSAVERRLRSDETAREVREALQTRGVATLPGFLSPDALRSAAAEAASKADAAFVSRDRHNVFLREADPELAADHVRNRLVDTVVASIACDELDPDGVIARLYWGPVGDALLELMSAIVGRPLHRLADPLGAVSVNVFRPGMGHGFHFDESLYTMTLCLQKAERGGEFLFSGPLRSSEQDLATEAVEAILDTGCGVEALEFEPGTLSLFCGQLSLHCVTPVQGAKDRLVAVFCFAPEPGVRNSAKVQEQFWGRSRL